MDHVWLVVSTAFDLATITASRRMSHPRQKQHLPHCEDFISLPMPKRSWHAPARYRVITNVQIDRTVLFRQHIVTKAHDKCHDPTSGFNLDKNKPDPKIIFWRWCETYHQFKTAPDTTNILFFSPSFIWTHLTKTNMNFFILYAWLWKSNEKETSCNIV